MDPSGKLGLVMMLSALLASRHPDDDILVEHPDTIDPPIFPIDYPEMLEFAELFNNGPGKKNHQHVVRLDRPSNPEHWQAALKRKNERRTGTFLLDKARRAKGRL